MTFEFSIFTSSLLSHLIPYMSDPELLQEIREVRARIALVERALSLFARCGSKEARLQLVGEDRSLDAYVHFSIERLGDLYAQLQQKELLLLEEKQQLTGKSLGACCVRA